ncbi:MAG: DUF2235 domain-containing protein [Hyphomonadaceae bacterium]|nr:DUF2235 domain-containing protein [Hyphomonadaceae bacterium]
MGRNILIFSDGTGQAGGYMPDERRSNVYKLFRATRVSPDTSIDPSRQIAFYDGGLGSRGSGEGIRLSWWRRIYNFLGQTTGLGITQNIIDCYAEIIRIWQPGDRIYLFGFSRGAYTVRCVAGVLKYCGVPTAVACEISGQVRPLQRDLRSARRIASEAVKHVYQHGSSVRRDPHRREREALARGFRAKYCSGDAKTSNTAPYFIGVWDTVGTLGAGSVMLALLAGAHFAAAAAVAGLLALVLGWPFHPLLAAFGFGVPMGLYLGLCLRYRGLASLARYRMAFYDTHLHYAVRYGRHALAIDENRKRFECVPWDEDSGRGREAPAAHLSARFKQVWFAGSHSDIGGSYPETESRLSDIALGWMVEEASRLPEPIIIDRSLLRLYPDSAGAQHDERKAFFSACPGWLTWVALLLIDRRNFGWREGHRHIPEDALLHPTVLERFKRPAVLIHGTMVSYRPPALRRHPRTRAYYPPPDAPAPRPAASAFGSSQPEPSPS